MSTTSLVFMFSVLVSLAHSSSSVCKIVTLNRTILHVGNRLNGFQFYRMNNVPDVLQCARFCFFRRRCFSFNYNANKTSCEFNNARVNPPNATLSKSADFVYSNIEDWDEAIGFGPCSKRPCHICEACYPTESNYTCIKEEMTSCRDVKICTNASSDGEYYIRPIMGASTWLKIYCHRMNTTYPKDYLTLLKENYSKYPPMHYLSCSNHDWNRGPPGVIYYWKIRLDVTTFHVDTGDRTFTNVSCDPILFGISNPNAFKDTGKTCRPNLRYGTGADCMYKVCKPRRGKFHINLEGTGLIVAPSVKWKADGYVAQISSFYRSPTSQVITATCGGNCGSCYPNGFLTLQQKP